MCRSCRALIPRAAATCPECGAGAATVRAPGLGRLVANVIPGATTATSLLLLANGALFALMLMTSLSDGTPRGLFAAFDGLTLIRFGSGFNPLTVGSSEWWRLVTPIFLHAGLIHFAFNTYALIQLAPLVEEQYGTERFVVLYVLTGICGNVFSQVFWPGIRHTVGASGAICGMVGLLLAYGMRRGGAIGSWIRSSMMRSVVSVLLLSLLPGIDLLCHLGGLVSGFLLGWVVPAGVFRTRAAARAWSALLLLVVVLILWSFWQVAQHGPEAVQRILAEEY
jgi:rhomboid protease GluP